MKVKEILLTQGFGVSLGNEELDAEKVKNILSARHPKEFMEMVDKLGDTISEERIKEEAEVIYNEFGFNKCRYFIDCKKEFAEVSPTLEKYKLFIVLLKFNV